MCVSPRVRLLHAVCRQARSRRARSRRAGETLCPVSGHRCFLVESAVGLAESRNRGHNAAGLRLIHAHPSPDGTSDPSGLLPFVLKPPHCLSLLTRYELPRRHPAACSLYLWDLGGAAPLTRKLAFTPRSSCRTGPGPRRRGSGFISRKPSPRPGLPRSTSHTGLPPHRGPPHWASRSPGAGNTSFSSACRQHLAERETLPSRQTVVPLTDGFSYLSC